ncbi:MAG: nucleotidyltransferase domain-containing protein [Candidatus Omnitrophota bacterium]
MDKKVKNIDKVKEILKKNHSVKYAFLFGSIIKKPLPGSDADILIGGELDFSERTDLALELELTLKRKVDIVLVNQAAPGLVLKAFSLGIALCAKEKEEMKADYFRNLRLHEDGKNLQKLKISRIKRRHENG